MKALTKEHASSAKLLSFGAHGDTKLCCLCPKGQLISKCPYEKSVWTKYQRKYFCPGSLLLQG